ncbi:MAG TPA: carbohydrate-binding protein [Citreicella sp.]|jgi:hypothetical protein|nr:carbohydrate-binding protein [Citreicella sp.]
MSRLSSTRLDAYWFWDHLPHEAELRRQLMQFHAQGFGRIFIQARLSMPRALYLSPAYLATYARAVAIMAELGLTAGIYDDYAWTSGQAGGRSVAGADALREEHLFWAESPGPEAQISGITATLAAALGPAVRHWIHDGGTPGFGAWAVVAAVIWPVSGPPVDVTEAVRLTGTGPAGASFRLTCPLPEGARWTVFARARATRSRLINYLMPEAGARFVEQGLEPYADALGPHLGRTVDCLFFDQPAPGLYDWAERQGNLRNSLPWSDGLARALRRSGSLAPQLAALLRDTGPDTGPIRATVYRTLTQMMTQAFLGPLRAFCDRTGLRLTGHEILPHVASFDLNGGFSAIDPRVALAADFFGIDRWRDETAVDANNLGAQLAPLLGDSVAQAAGRRGAWCELYLTSERSEARAAGQWDLTPEALRGQLIRLHLLGASRIILHALYAGPGDSRASVLDNLRFDFPPGYNLQPWWPVLGAIAEEMAQLAAFVEAATPPARVLLLYPYETALREGPRHGHATAFGAWCRAILSLGHRPLICDEAGLAALVSPGAAVGVALPGPVRLAEPQTATRLRDTGLPVWTAPPADLAQILAAAAPVVPEVPGLRALVAGRDAAGDWRVVLVNESAAPLVAEILSRTGLACGTMDSAARRIAVPLDPQELRCLTLTPEPARQDSARLAPTRRAPGPVLQRLEDGWTLHLGNDARPVRVDRGWQAQGAAEVSGIGRYERTLDLAEAADLVLDLPGVACTARVWLDGRDLGQRFAAPFRFNLGRVAAGAHLLRIDVANTMANAFYAGTPFAGSGGPDASGLTQVPLLRRAD